MNKIFAVVLGLILSVVMAASAFAAPVAVDTSKISVEVDGFALTEGDTSTIRQLERGEDFDLKVRLVATANIKDLEIHAFVTGFEHAKSEPISESTRAFDLEENESVVKTLKLTLPERADEDKYKLRVVIADRFRDAITLNYNIKIEPSDAEVAIRDFELSPEDEVQAGRAVLATVRVKNFGDSDEEDVRIKVSIPDLGVSATPDFIDELEPDESATSEEFFLKIDSCAKPGIYDVVAEVTFDEGDEKVTAKKSLTVKKGICDAVAEPGQAQVPGKTTIAFSTEPQNVAAGGAAASYPVTITNSGTTTRAFMLVVDSANWADFTVSPSNLVTVKPGSTQTVFVSVAAKQGTASGERVFTVSVKDAAGDTLQSLAMRANVVAGADVTSLRNALTVGLVVIVAILVVVGLVLAFRRVKGGEEGESQTYY